MRALPERDAAALLAVVAELGALDDAEPFPPCLLERLGRLLGCRNVAYADLDRGRHVFNHGTWWVDGEGGIDLEDADADHPYWRLRHSHPVCGHRERAGEWTTTRMVSDFVSLREFHGSEIWDESLRHQPINDWIDVGLRPTGKQTRMFLFVNDRPTFTERDRLVLELLQPHLQRRYDRVHAAAEAAAALVGLEEVADDDPRHIVLCSTAGAIEFASSESRRLLATYFDCERGHVPDVVLREPDFATPPRDGKRLTVHSVRSGDLHVVLLGEEDTRLDRLTARQRTIVDHVARGETDAQIAAALGIAPATVNKHLEQIYERLEVHTRTAAAALVR